MLRSCKITLKFATKRKRRAIDALLSRYRSAVNFYIDQIWNRNGNLSAATASALKGSVLSARYKSQALKQAVDIVSSTKKAAKATGNSAGLPSFCGNAVLDAKFVSIETGKRNFDLVVRLSSLISRTRLTIPSRRTQILNKWLAVPGACLIQGCSLSENSLSLWVNVTDVPCKTEGTVLGVDIGINKLLSTSDGIHLGDSFKDISKKIRRKKPGSNARQKAYRERQNFIGNQVNKLPWKDLSTIGVELLHDMKRGKKKGRTKEFRKAIAPWTYRQVLNRIAQKAQENRVRLVAVEPANTSRTCPICGKCDKLNRRREDFLCIGCGHKADADTVGAQNILARTLQILGSVESPSLKRR